MTKNNKDCKNSEKNSNNQKATVEFASEEIKRGCCSKCHITDSKSQCPKGQCP